MCRYLTVSLKATYKVHRKKEPSQYITLLLKRLYWLPDRGRIDFRIIYTVKTDRLK
jgi:hypothetical protein